MGKKSRGKKAGSGVGDGGRMAASVAPAWLLPSDAKAVRAVRRLVAGMRGTNPVWLNLVVRKMLRPKRKRKGTKGGAPPAARGSSAGGGVRPPSERGAAEGGAEASSRGKRRSPHSPSAVSSDAGNKNKKARAGKRAAERESPDELAQEPPAPKAVLREEGGAKDRAGGWLAQARSKAVAGSGTSPSKKKQQVPDAADTMGRGGPEAGDAGAGGLQAGEAGECRETGEVIVINSDNSSNASLPTSDASETEEYDDGESEDEERGDRGKGRGHRDWMPEAGGRDESESEEEEEDGGSRGGRRAPAARDEEKKRRRKHKGDDDGDWRPEAEAYGESESEEDECSDGGEGLRRAPATRSGGVWEELASRTRATRSASSPPQHPSAEAPPPPQQRKPAVSAYAIDCEMVGAGPGRRKSLLARVAVVDTTGEVLMDTFVRPTERVTDYRTRWSGVRPRDLVGAPAFQDVRQRVAALVRGKLLVGHAIENDLKALQLPHPPALTRDTSRYRPLRAELSGVREGYDGSQPPSLKALSEGLLGRKIQGGEHCPVEDSRATMQLYMRCREKWEAELM